MWHKLLLLSCLALAMSGRQVIDATSGPWTAELTGPWRWHAGDNLQWASPALEDSTWKALPVPGPLPRTSGPYWIRLKVETGTMTNPGLLLGPIAYEYEVYWDGRRIGGFGRLPPHKTSLMPRWEIFHVSPATAAIGSHAVAIRVGPPQKEFGREPRLSPAENRVGDVRALREAEGSLHGADFRPRALNLLIEFALLLAGVYFLLLQPSVSQGSAFRWLGVLLISRALAVACEFVGSDVPLPIPYELLIRISVLGGAAYVIAIIQFAYAVFRRRTPVAVLCLQVAIAGLGVFYVPTRLWNLCYWNCFLLANILIVAVAGRELRRRTPGVGVTFALLLILGVVNGLVALVIQYRIPINMALFFGEFRVWDIDFVLLLWLPAMAGQTYKTNQRLRDERERLRGEMDAARHVQEMLLPSRNIAIPGFAVDAAYRPATEVGGDFFQVLPAANGGFLLVVGDVSGKGMKAALLVSLIVGALQNRKSDQPATVLADLNRSLLGRSEDGFTTCCCALFTEEHSLLVANAGHLPPYCNGTEIETPPGLPLGIVPDAHWSEIRIDLHPGDRIVWLSDGVVEARNGHRDVLGFARVQQLIRASAAEIAHAAQKFGQEDDITVIAVTHP